MRQASIETIVVWLAVVELAILTHNHPCLRSALLFDFFFTLNDAADAEMSPARFHRH